ncbi:MAG TPA: hypothetical protein VH879_12780 [Gemmatimonadales bacterium]|jgi:hypothetical protein
MGKRVVPVGLALLIGVAGCATLGHVIDELATERPPAPLSEATVASDARLDSSGAIAGSFVGEGTSRQVHLLSSDTALIAGLGRRYRPVHDRRGDTWAWLAQRGTFLITLDPIADSALARQGILAGSPDGHTPVRLRSIVLHGSRCGWRGAQAELVVEASGRSGPSLRGPVVGALFAPDDLRSQTGRGYRDEVQAPTPELTDSLIVWTSRAMDSLLERRLPSRELPLSPESDVRLSVNGLTDENAADVLAFRLDDGRVRYAVSLREARRTAPGVRLQAAIVMVWDATGAWRQVVFRPTLLEYRRRRLARAYTGATQPLYWRRLDAVSGFAYRRDYLWMEQVDVEEGSVLWVILQPRDNTVVAAAEMEGPC